MSQNEKINSTSPGSKDPGVKHDEKVVETKVCKHCKASFDITDKDLEFYEKISPSFPSPDSKESGLNGVKKLGNGKVKYLIPSPTLCPDCRQQRRLSFRNERNLYKRKCDFSGREIITMFSPDKPYKVYAQDIWQSDKWDALDYGRDFDFNRPFFEQFNELIKEVPHFHNAVVNNSNSDYVNYSANSADSYLIFASSQNKSCYYCRWVMNNEKIMDSNNTMDCQECYYCVDVNNSIGDFYCVRCKDTSFCFACYDLIGCQNCIACSNLRNKKYHIFNKEYTREEYEKEKEKYKNYEELLRQVLKKAIHKNLNLTNTENCSGDYLIDSKKCSHCFDGEKLENCKNSCNTLDMDNSQDIDFQAFDTHYCYEALGLEYTTKTLFSYASIEGSSEIYYSFGAISSSHLFGCAYVKNKKYCIFNKQYTKEEYEELVPRIITHMMKTGEWGEFFPASLSPFGYNETVAQEYYRARLSEDKKQMITENGKRYEINIIGNKNILCHSVPTSGSESLKNKNLNQEKDPEINSGGQLIHGKIFNWSDYQASFPKVAKIIPASKLPYDISQVPDDILNWAIEDEERKTKGLNPLFRIIPQELAFYRKHHLPIPRRHPDERHLERMNLRNPRKIFTRSCDKCGKEIKTTYAPERPEIVYCQTCYEKEIY